MDKSLCLTCGWILSITQIMAIFLGKFKASKNAIFLSGCKTTEEHMAPHI